MAAAPLTVAALIAAGGLAACGNEEEQPPVARKSQASSTAEPESSPARPVARAPLAPDPPADAPGAGESVQGGAGDEGGMQTPAAFVLKDDGVTPASRVVPAFIAVELRVDNRTSGLRRVVLRTRQQRVDFDVKAGEQAAVRIEGQPPGRYSIRFGKDQEATLVARSE